MKKYLNYTLTAFALCALMACSEDTSSSGSSGLAPDGGKELIAFSQKGSAMTTRAMTRDGFTADTKVVMRIKAEGAAATDIRYTQAVATASAQIASDACNTDYGLGGSHSHLTYAAGQNRYWDDAFGRESKLTVYAVAVPNKSNIIADIQFATCGEALQGDVLIRSSVVVCPNEICNCAIVESRPFVQHNGYP